MIFSPCRDCNTHAEALRTIFGVCEKQDQLSGCGGRFDFFLKMLWQNPACICLHTTCGYFIAGVVARHPSFVNYIRRALTAETVDNYLAHLFEDRSGPVESRVLRCGSLLLWPSAFVSPESRVNHLGLSSGLAKVPFL